MSTVNMDKYFKKFDYEGASTLTVFKALKHSTFIGRNNGQQGTQEEQRAKQIPKSKTSEVVVPQTESRGTDSAGKVACKLWYIGWCFAK